MDVVGLSATLWRAAVMFSAERRGRARVGGLMSVIDPVSSNFLIILFTVEALGTFRLPKIGRNLRIVAVKLHHFCNIAEQ